VDRLSRITEDLLTLARSDAGTLEPRLEPVQPLVVARELAPRLASLAPERRVRVEVTGEADVVIDADGDLLRRLLWNLGSNAVKFAPPDSVVSVTVERDREAVVLEVADQGPGVPAEARARIFERFYQVDPARSAQATPGTGLGLAITRAIAELHGASIEVRDRAGGGAAFRVRFPVAAG
jgi:signal transduction histidine kinase